jgi:radical SAM protein with 4Fe4S-binding SPASM domain
MKAKDISGQAPGGKRTILAEALPLDTPFVVQVFPIYACNFKCGYCIFSVPKPKRHFISDQGAMDFDLYQKCVDDMARFPHPVKVLRLVGIGEPLLHRKIADMIGYAVSKGIAQTVELLTNASLMTPTLADALISAGLSRLVVSLQGTSREKYAQVCGAHIDFQQLIANLTYFFQNKNRTHVYIKVIDCALDGPEDERRFYEIFGDICDTMGIEHAVPIHTGVPYEKVLKEKKGELTQFGLPVSEVPICPQSFFTLQINPDGKIVPCYSFEYPGIMGDCRKETVPEIWSGRRFREFRRKTLDGSRTASPVCANCSIIRYRLFPEDVLNQHAERLKKYYES